MDYEIACADAAGTPANKRRGGGHHIRSLLEKFGADDENSALMTAVEQNDGETVEELLLSASSRGVVDLGARDPATGNTALHTAARLGHGRLCALLVRHGADVNARNHARFTPLFFAARVDLPTVCVLLDLGAEARLCNHLGELPLHAASSSGLIDVMVTLISRCGSDVNARSAQGLTPLCCAVGSGSRQAVKALLRLGAEVNGVGVVVAGEGSRTSPTTPPTPHRANSAEKQSCPLLWKETADPRARSTGKKHKKNRLEVEVEDVRVCVSRQTQLLPSAGQLSLGGCAVVPDSPGIDTELQRGCDEGGDPDPGQQRGFYIQCPNHPLSRVGPANLPTAIRRGYAVPHHHHPHLHHHHNQTRHQHLHRLGKREESSSSSSPVAHRTVLLNVLENETEKKGEKCLVEDSGTALKSSYPSSAAHRTVFNALENDTENEIEQSLVEDSRTPGLPVSNLPRCSRNAVAHPQHPVHTSSIVHDAAANHVHQLRSACLVEMCRGKTQTLHPKQKMGSGHPTPDEHSRSSRSRSVATLSEFPFMQSQKKWDALDEVATSQADTGLRSSPHRRHIGTAEQSTMSVDKMSVPCIQSQKLDALDEVTSVSQADTRLRRSPHPHHNTATAAESPTTAAPNCQGLTPLHRASMLGMESVAQVLLDAGAEVNARTRRGETALHMAALYSSTTTGHGEVTGLLRLLLGAGADVEAVSSPRGSTPLHLAALMGDALCTSLLLSVGADLHKRDSDGNTPLHKACERIVSPEANRLRTVRLLLTNGASTRAVNQEGLTPLHVLLMHRTDELDHDVVRVLLSHRADPDLVTPSGEAPLLVALRNHMYGFAKVLVEKGAEPNIAADDSKTPLHYVCREGRLQLFKLIWSKGGDPARPDVHGLTPLRCAVESGQEAMIQACIASGASTWQPSPDVLAASSVRGLFANPARYSSPFQFAFATAQLARVSVLYHAGCFSSTELHCLRKLCAAVTGLRELSGPQQEVVSFVLCVSEAPASLQNLTRWKISHLIGCGADRKWRARELGLPALLRDFVLFL